MKNTFLVAIALLTSAAVSGQTNTFFAGDWRATKVSKTFTNKPTSAQTNVFKAKLYPADKPVSLHVDYVTAEIEGYDGDEIIIEAIPSIAKTQLAESAGLKEITLLGRDKDDNLINPRLQEDTSSMQITIPPGKFHHLRIKVPQTIVLFMTTTMNLIDDKISVDNVNSIVIQGTLGSIDIKRVSNFCIEGGGYHQGSRATGKITISDIRWTSDPVIINGRPDMPHYLTRTYIVDNTNSTIELSVSADAKANIVFCSNYGKTYSNLGTKPVPSSPKDTLKFTQFYRHIQPLQTILLNGGGVNVIVKNDFADIYLKKQ